MAFTYFYRDLQTLEVMIDHMLPSLNGKRTIDIWSAGCAMGPEPYTIALLLKENMGAMDFSRIRILASDIDRTNNYGAILIQGRYPFEELERIPNEHFTRNFTRIQIQRSLIILRKSGTKSASSGMISSPYTLPAGISH